MAEELAFAGQYVIDNLDWLQPGGGLALDVREYYDQITIYEDMFAPFMSGNIIFRDTLDMPNLFLNSGTDLIRIRVRTPSIPEKFAIDRYFHIYKIDEREEESDRSISYIVHFTSGENIQDQATKISKTFKGNSQDIFKQINDQYLESEQPLVSDKSTNIIQYTSNFWIPTKNFSHVANLAIGETGLPSFVYFENRHGLNLIELTKFAAKDYPVLQYFQTSDYTTDISNSPLTQGMIQRDFSKDYQTVSNMDMKVNYDHMKDSAAGLMKTRMFTYDMVTRTFSDKLSTVLDAELPLLNEQRFYKKSVIDSAGAVHMLGFSHYDLYGRSANSSNPLTDSHKRNVIMRAYQQHKIEITVIGRTDYTIGKKVIFTANKMRGFSAETPLNDIVDNLTSGNYIVSAVRHIFNRKNQHECKIELMTDSIRNQA